MKNVKWICILIIMVSMIGCATVSQPIVEPLPQEEADISKTLVQDSQYSLKEKYQ